MLRWIKILLFIGGFGAVFTGISFFVYATTNIDPTNRWAYDDITGFWDMYETDTVTVDSQSIHGYASTSLGAVAFNCDSTPNGNICGTSNFKVCNGDWDGANCVNTGTGRLSGCAWNDNIGWISLSCKSYDCGGFGGSHDICTQSPYWVGIDADGNFSGVQSPAYTGYAWNDTVGWINFNCANPGSNCDTPYSTQTDWRPGRTVGLLDSSIIDTQDETGVTLNSIIWQGVSATDSPVDFQVAVSNSPSGPWNYKGPNGADSAYYGASCPIVGSGGSLPNLPVCIDSEQVVNYRYLRYRLRIQSNLAQTTSSQVYQIILNFSP